MIEISPFSGPSEQETQPARRQTCVARAPGYDTNGDGQIDAIDTNGDGFADSRIVRAHAPGPVRTHSARAAGLAPKHTCRSTTHATHATQQKDSTEEAL